MCGIVGFLATKIEFESTTYEILGRQMADRLQHRGPDDQGVWADPQAGVVLSQRRLAIIDLSPEGHQPMRSACGRYVLSFNGEIYNFLALRNILEGLGHRFRGHSDTEVILAAFSQWGIVPAVQRFNGMFAIAVWDNQTQMLELICDRLGQKPLYVGWAKNALLFASELKALHAFPDFKPTINRNALTLLLRRGCIAAPYTIYDQVAKVKPGCHLSITRKQLASGEHTLSQDPYWSATTVLEEGERTPFTGSAEQAVDILEELLCDAVKLCMVSDVPLGAFLSGGVDSSLIVALMQCQSEQPIRTFAIGFHEQQYNEAPYAAAVAHHLGTKHTELYVTELDALAVIPTLPTLYDEPFADSSQIPTYLLAKLTRQHVTVALSGDGGDEIFGGYAKYRYLERLHPLTRIPQTLSTSVIKTLQHLPVPTPAQWRELPFGPVGAWFATQDYRQKAQRAAAMVASTQSSARLYTHLASIWKNPEQVVLGAHEPSTLVTTPTAWPRLRHSVRQAMALDLLTYLPDDILVKVDRAAMAVSLETRIPFLDHRVLAFAAQAPLAMHRPHGQSKALLRKVLYRYVPPALIERPKKGFKVPLASWLRCELRPWAEALLTPARLQSEGFFAITPIQQKWQEHLTGSHDWSGYLWPILMFQAWHEQWASNYQ